MEEVLEKISVGGSSPKIIKDLPVSRRNWQNGPAKRHLIRKTHPEQHGVRMQLHHILAQESFNTIIKEIKRKIEAFHYDINVAENLIALPYDLKAACILHVQPHRGAHLKTYYKRTARAIMEDEKLKLMLAHHPQQSGDKLKRYIQNRINKISAQTLKKIANFKLAIHHHATDYAQGQPGCCGRTRINETATTNCQHSRSHENDRRIELPLFKAKRLTPAEKQARIAEGKASTDYVSVPNEISELYIQFNGQWTLEPGL